MAAAHPFVQHQAYKDGQDGGVGEQIVPALRKRLEYESAYLSNRLSSTNFAEFQLQPLPHENHHQSSTSTQTSLCVKPDVSFPDSSGIRHDEVEAGPSHHPAQSRQIAQNHSIHGSAPPHDSSTPSRVPIRERSKSNLGSRPSLSTENAPPLPTSSLPRSLPNDHGPVVSRQNTSKTRNSLDIQQQLEQEGFIKNELPPFRLMPDEALRIAERGHAIDGGKDHDYHDELAGNATETQGVEEGSKRKRAITMRIPPTDTTNRPRSFQTDEISGSSEAGRRRRTSLRPSSGKGSAEISTNIPRSGTASIGLGRPSSRNTSSATSGNRSSSSRHPKSPSSSPAPRSISVNQNLLASPSVNTPSRLGVAAHFVPPENTYTPPKGANWDEVVLPTVAKRLGINEDREFEADESDLAVEWDKDGTPIKWIKREAIKRVGVDRKRLTQGYNQGLTSDDYIHRSNLAPSTSAAPLSHFSSSFEPSPESPLQQHPPAHIRRVPSKEGSPSPSPRPQKSAEVFEMGPIRASSSRPTQFSELVSDHSLKDRETEISPDRFNTGQTPEEKLHNDETDKRSRSVLRQLSSQHVNQGPLPLRQDARARGETHQPNPNTLSRRQDLTYRDSQRTPLSKKQELEGQHGKGCACLIM